MKYLFILITVLILFILILSITLKIMFDKIEKNKKMIYTLDSKVSEKNSEILKLKEEIEIEQKHKQILAKKIADISCMSINDILHELQNSNN